MCIKQCVSCAAKFSSTTMANYQSMSSVDEQDSFGFVLQLAQKCIDIALLIGSLEMKQFNRTIVSLRQNCEAIDISEKLRRLDSVTKF